MENVRVLAWPKGIDDLKQALEDLHYAPEIDYDEDHFRFTVEVKFGGVGYGSTVAEEFAKKLDKKSIGTLVRMIHEAVVRGEAKRLGLLETAWMNGMSDSLAAADPQGYAGKETISAPGRAILDLRPPAALSR